LVQPPGCPPALQRWVAFEDIANSSLTTLRLLESIPRQTDDEAEQPLNQNEDVDFGQDHPELNDILTEYIDSRWKPWAEQDRIDRKIKSTYETLFSIYQIQQRSGEQFEIVLGMGLLLWQPRDGARVRRHLITLPAGVSFDALTGSISVVPGPDGAGAVLEQDMLEPEFRPDLTEEQRVKALLETLGESVGDRDLIGSALTAWVNAVSANGRYVEAASPDISDFHTPIIQLAPALIVRRRTDRSLLRFLSEALEQLETERAIPQGILGLVETSDEAVFTDESVSSFASKDQTLYFPLEANDEQLEIVKRLQYRNGVLVQGPPGTGKSHTIANLIAHLLATGQRVLVTSHTPRALSVLRDKIPEEIQSLCVSLVGTDRTAIEEVEASVLGITQRFDRYDRSEQRNTIADLERQLDKQRRSNTQSAGELRAFRERETYRHELGFGDYEGTAQRIAERISVEKSLLGWIPDSVPVDSEVPLTSREAENLLRITRHLTDARIELLESLKVSSEDLPYPDEFEEFVTRERTAKIISDDYQTVRTLPLYHQLARADKIQRAEIGSRIARIREEFATLRTYPAITVSQLFDAISAGEYRTLRQLHGDSAEALRQLENAASVIQAEVMGLDHADRAAIATDATALLAHLRSGGGKGIPGMRPKVVKETDYLARSLFVDGMPCSNETTLARLLAWIAADRLLDNISKRWEPFESIAHSSMARRIEELGELTTILGCVLLICDRFDALFRETGIEPATRDVSLETDRHLVELLHICEAVDAEEHARRATVALNTAMSVITNFKGDHPLLSDISSTVVDRSVERYRTCFEALVQCDQDRVQLDLRDQLLDRLQTVAPQLLQTFRGTYGESMWDAQISNLRLAWNHARARTWLEEFQRPGRHAELLKQVERGHANERALVRKLSAELAWLEFFGRMTQSQSQHLRAWALAVRKIGKGTGKYAPIHRQAAREHMEVCRPAIPAWIMPIYRVTETLSPNIDTFDVIIVDEASQSGPEALFLQYIAKKIIVVGDDKQISPTIFTDQEAVDLLRKRHIPDLPHSETLGVNNSFFDQAVIRYSGRVQLREHFRCMPEIIQFSNNLSYSNSPLIPLRQYGIDRLEPVRTTHVSDGYEPNTAGADSTNPPEAEAIAK